MKEWHGFLAYYDTRTLKNNFFLQFWTTFKGISSSKMAEVGRENLKADGLGQLNTEKQVLSKTEALANTAGSSFHIRPSPLQSLHLLAGDHMT